MSKISSILLLAILTIILPFLGIPQTWKSFLTFIFAVITAVFAYSIRKKMTKSENVKDDQQDKVYSENDLKK